MQPDTRDIHEPQSAAPVLVGDAEVKHLLEEAGRTWSVLQDDLDGEGYRPHPAA